MTWYLASVVMAGDDVRILDTKPCRSTDYVDAWMEAGEIIRSPDAKACVIVIDKATAHLAGVRNVR